MALSEIISVLIFVLIFMAAVVYVVMSGYVVGPWSKLRRGEQIILAISLVGILLVLVYAATELLFYVVF